VKSILRFGVIDLGPPKEGNRVWTSETFAGTPEDLAKEPENFYQGKVFEGEFRGDRTRLQGFKSLEGLLFPIGASLRTYAIHLAISGF